MHALLLQADETRVQQKRRYRPRPAVELLRFLDAAARAMPPGLGLHVVLDGHRAHHEEVLRSFAARHPPLEVHVAPSRARFVELAGRVLALPTERAYGRGTHQDVQPEVRALLSGSPPAVPLVSPMPTDVPFMPGAQASCRYVQPGGPDTSDQPLPCDAQR
jgi:hypothetical protein